MSQSKAAAKTAMLSALNAMIERIKTSAGLQEDEIRTLITQLIATTEQASDKTNVANLMTPKNVHGVVDGAIAALVGASPATLDTIAELAAVFQNNPEIVNEIIARFNQHYTKTQIDNIINQLPGSLTVYANAEQINTLLGLGAQGAAYSLADGIYVFGYHSVARGVLFDLAKGAAPLNLYVTVSVETRVWEYTVVDIDTGKVHAAHATMGTSNADPCALVSFGKTDTEAALDMLGLDGIVPAVNLTVPYKAEATVYWSYKLEDQVPSTKVWATVEHEAKTLVGFANLTKTAVADNSLTSLDIRPALASNVVPGAVGDDKELNGEATSINAFDGNQSTAYTTNATTSQNIVEFKLAEPVGVDKSKFKMDTLTITIETVDSVTEILKGVALSIGGKAQEHLLYTVNKKGADVYDVVIRSKIGFVAGSGDARTGTWVKLDLSARVGGIKIFEIKPAFVEGITDLIYRAELHARNTLGDQVVLYYEADHTGVGKWQQLVGGSSNAEFTPATADGDYDILATMLHLFEASDQPSTVEDIIFDIPAMSTLVNQSQIKYASNQKLITSVMDDGSWKVESVVAMDNTAEQTNTIASGRWLSASGTAGNWTTLIELVGSNSAATVGTVAGGKTAAVALNSAADAKELLEATALFKLTFSNTTASKTVIQHSSLEVVNDHRVLTA